MLTCENFSLTLYFINVIIYHCVEHILILKGELKMKRNVTKVLSVLLVLVMAMSLMACGSKKSDDKKSNKNLASLTAEELVNKVSEATTDVKGISSKITLDAAVTASGMDMSVSGTVESKANVDPAESYVKVDLSSNALGQDRNVNSEVYMVQNDDKIDTYTLYDGEWSYESADLSEYTDSITDLVSQLQSIDYKEVSKYFGEGKVEKKNGNYQLTMSTSTEDLLNNLEASEYGDKLKSVDLSAVPMATITLKVILDGETYLPVSAKVGFDMDKITYEEIEIELTKFDFGIDFTSYDAVDIKVPDEALAAK